MVTTARGYPRFVPTLTEVVRAPAPPAEPPPDPALLEAELREAVEAQRRQEAARRQEVVERLRAHLLTSVDDRIQDMVAGSMLEQVDLVGERLRRQMDDMVRDAFETIAMRLRAELEVLVDEAVDAVLAVVPPEPVAEPSHVAPVDPAA
jgi:hypothetical protein